MTSQLQAKISYLKPGVERPVYYASTAGADAAMKIGAEFSETEVTITDARELQPAASLDIEGFQLNKHISAVVDFYKLESVQPAYEAEIIALVLQETGASDAMVFDHTLRSDSSSVRGARTIREPASVIHNDYTDASAEKRLRDLLSLEEAQARLKHRYAIVNVWRSIAGPVVNSPMTCCDARTLSPGDLVASERRAAERVGELELVLWNPDHRWYYFSEMTPDEVLLLKTFDSTSDGRARRSVHTAFDNPLATADAPPRESIESRLLVFFD
jgi:hypothetical protein